MSQQHLHNKIGNVIGEAKKRMYERLKGGAELRTAISEFVRELQQALAEIVAKT